MPAAMLVVQPVRRERPPLTHPPLCGGPLPLPKWERGLKGGLQFPLPSRRDGRVRARGYSAASSRSAPPRSTLTSRDTPFSIMVTPNRRCMRAMVTALWVTIR